MLKPLREFDEIEWRGLMSEFNPPLSSSDLSLGRGVLHWLSIALLFIFSSIFLFFLSYIYC
jgi:hypothetical protein